MAKLSFILRRVFSRFCSARQPFISSIISHAVRVGAFGQAFSRRFLCSATMCLAINARFAHNDLYMLFFATLSIYFLFGYVEKQERGWLYASFFTVGLTASSKYNGGIFLLVPLVVWAGFRYRTFWAQKLRTLETLFISAVLTFGGFALGTPKALLWMVYYFKRALPAISRHATFNTANLPRGVIGQWAMMWEMFGGVLFTLALIATAYFAYKALAGFVIS
jgi:4-amino-4-deoxy-L-arabinose transferase-like glycosyltransferase